MREHAPRLSPISRTTFPTSPRRRGAGRPQVNQGHVTEVDDVYEKLQWDFYYIKYFSSWLDILIVFRTIKTMLNGFGAR